MKKTLCALMILIFTLTACAAASPAMGSNETVSLSSSMAIQELNDASAETSAPLKQDLPLPENRKIVRHISMTLEAENFDDSLTKLRQTIADAGGYIEQENVRGRSLKERGEENPRNADLTARIPSEKLDKTTEVLSSFCNVVERGESADDVTERYFDSQAHLRSLELQEERLLAILEKAEKLEDVVALEEALANVRYEIETITASIKQMDSQVAYSYLEIHLREVAIYTISQKMPKTFQEEMSAAFTISLDKLSAFSRHLILGLVETGPVFLFGLAFWGLGLTIVFLLIRKILRALRKKPTIPDKKESPPPDDSKS